VAAEALKQWASTLSFSLGPLRHAAGRRAGRGVDMTTTLPAGPCLAESPYPLQNATRDPLVEADAALTRLARLDPTDPATRPARVRLREQIIRDCLPAARREAARYRYTGESMEDLAQIAAVGLIQAIDRFDPSRGVPFRHFAAPTIAGELKRHFRDKGWTVRVTRRVQELHQEINRAEPALAQQLRRTPTVRDLAEHLRLPEADVLAGRRAGGAYSARSLNWRVSDDEDAVELGELIGSDDHALEAVADLEALRAALRALPERLRLLLSLRYVDELTQHQIADKLGISQMHVSRLITRATGILRGHMLAEGPLSRWCLHRMLHSPTASLPGAE
jgi:RNA polymerase sigma-B factor